MKRKLSIGVGCIIIVLVMALWYVKPSKIDIITEQIISFKSESKEEPMITLELVDDYDDIYKYLVNLPTDEGVVTLSIKFEYLSCFIRFHQIKINWSQKWRQKDHILD